MSVLAIARKHLKICAYATSFSVIGAFWGITQSAAAQSDQTPTSVEVGADSGDWALAFIDFLFRGVPLPESLSPYGARLTPLAEALGNGLAVYSLAMLVLAGIILFYHLAAMIASTAHDGVILGRRTNQIWAPIRLVVAITLLVPVGSSLSSGQFIVLKIASSGSRIASHAWRTMVDATDDNFSTLVVPNGPDTTLRAARAVEMELCRQIYHQNLAAENNETAARLMGDISDITKISGNQIGYETWRYTNILNAAAPLCGEYQFTGFRRHTTVNTFYSDNTTQMSEDLSTFSHTEAERLMTDARGVAAKAAPIFSNGEAPTALDIQGDIKSLQKSLQNDVDTRLGEMLSTNNAAAHRYLTLPNDAGWVAAAFFIPELVRLQETFGELADHMLPDVEQPIFAHSAVTQQVLADAMSADPTLHAIDHSVTDPIVRLYLQVARTNSHGLDWVYNSQIDDDINIPVTGQDLRDQFNANRSTDEAFAFFAHAIDSGAVSYGVWGLAPTENDYGNPFSITHRDSKHNPFTGLIEFGHRQLNLGFYLLGLGGTALTLPSAAAAAATTGFLGLSFLIGGFLLAFAVPFLPFMRFALGVLVWLLELFEALAAMPLVALAHLTPSGEGLSGSTARQAYLLWGSLLIRPVLTLFGLAIGLLLFTVGISVSDVAFVPLAHMGSSTNSGLFLVINVVVVLAYDFLILAIANVAFKGISQLPERALRWLSPFVVTEGRDIATTTVPNGTSPAPASSTTALSYTSSQSASHPGIMVGSSSTTNNGTVSSGRNTASSTSKQFVAPSAAITNDSPAPSSSPTSQGTLSPSSPLGTKPSVSGSGRSGSQADSGNGAPSNPFKNSAFFANKDKPNE